ncbi:Uncharacterised protein [Legionella lansingensis]|uniref:Uncharacterized protein n=1 Tax=Legionella lansingensis TaxID=45067 RepID=A0A0W0VPB0_9GAMM|nr:hypothetical protein [Legionella lansingensis]KTD21943.1 hypothetical protein Llan_1517 [Legionella lansingensis]SNV46010.1 Uncharacterised protein [Legionella lansingensis]
MFFKQPKIKRITMHLESVLEELCRERWTHYLNVVPSADSIRYNHHLATDIDKEKLFATPGIWRSKEHFSWRMDEPFSNGHPIWVEINAAGQYWYYSGLLKQARFIVAELNNPSPDYQKIIKAAKDIKGRTLTVPSVISADPITIGVGFIMGGNLLVNFFRGLVGLVHAPMMLLVGAFCSITYWCSFSEYCGSPAFFFDTLQYFCDSLWQVLSSVVFPLAMLYSKYMTDSYNVFTKGDVQRVVDGITSLAEVYLEDKEADQSHVDVILMELKG